MKPEQIGTTFTPPNAHAAHSIFRATAANREHKTLSHPLKPKTQYRRWDSNPHTYAGCASVAGLKCRVLFTIWNKTGTTKRSGESSDTKRSEPAPKTNEKH